jgi:hypothetical protein
MQLKKTICAYLFIGIYAVLLAPSVATAAVTLAIKKSATDAPFIITVESQEWLQAVNPSQFTDKDSVTFGGKYRSGAADGYGTDFSWLIDPASNVFDVVEISYVTSGGITTITGHFKSFSRGALPSGVKRAVAQASLVDITPNFYSLSGDTYTQAVLPGGLSVGLENPVPSIPEPEEYAMMLLGFAMVGHQIKRKQRL